MGQIIGAITYVAARIRQRVPLRSERAATSLEYAIIASAIAAVIVLAVAFLGRATNANFECTGESYSARANRC